LPPASTPRKPPKPGRLAVDQAWPAPIPAGVVVCGTDLATQPAFTQNHIHSESLTLPSEYGTNAKVICRAGNAFSAVSRPRYVGRDSPRGGWNGFRERSF